MIESMTHAPAQADARVGRDDHLTRFLLPEAGVRGVLVHLDETWKQIRSRADYPESIARLLGEASAASALFTGHAKVEGRLSVQLRGTGTLRTLFAECTAAGTLRGIAQLQEDAPPPQGLADLGPEPILAITIENPSPTGATPSATRGWSLWWGTTWPPRSSTTSSSPSSCPPASCWRPTASGRPA